jgi:hypothetical protein
MDGQGQFAAWVKLHSEGGNKTTFAMKIPNLDKSMKNTYTLPRTPRERKESRPVFIEFQFLICSSVIVKLDARVSIYKHATRYRDKRNVRGVSEAMTRFFP